MTPPTPDSPPVKRLEQQLAHIREILNRDGSFYSLKAEERQSLRQHADKILHKLFLIGDSFLKVGLLGGTGVGKSTIMNALAGAEISSTSHRRPHTDHILIYRHKESPPLTLAPEDLPWSEILHEKDSVKQILLCDLPDFDSLAAQNRETVLQFMEHLDILVWVASPEKYADASFYDFLRSVPKARRNFNFVLNKADILFEGESLEKGYGRLQTVSENFLRHIEAAGVEEPILYALSAQERLEEKKPTRWNQFPLFKQQIFQQRDMKQVAAIKSSNLEMEVHRIVSALQQELRTLRDFHDVLETAIGEFRDGRAQWEETGREAIELWLTQLGRDFTQARSDPSHLLGPGYPFALLLLNRENRSGLKQESSSEDPAPFHLPGEIAPYFQRRLEWMGDRLRHHLLRRNLPQSLHSPLKDVLDIPRAMEDLREGFYRLFGLKTAGFPLFTLWRFKATQIFVYLLVLGLFLLTLGGESAWLRVLDEPGLNSLLRLTLSIFYSLFSAKGLAALLSYTLVNLFLGFRFFRRYRKLLRRSAERTTKILRKELEEIWNGKLDLLLDRLGELKGEIGSGITAIAALEEEKGEGKKGHFISP
jgi:predicted GTPase